MRTKQHNLKPVERTVVASGLLGRPAEGHEADRYDVDACPWWVMVVAASSTGLIGISAKQPGDANLA